jgi:tetratricopeptide (TPR) repeat protein
MTSGEKSFSLGKLFKQKGKYEVMEKYYIEAVQKFKSSEAHLELLDYYLETNNTKKFNEYIDIAKTSNDEKILYWLSSFYEKTNNNNERENYLRLAIVSGSVDSMFALGEIYVSKNKYKNLDLYLFDLCDQNNMLAIYEIIKKYKHIDRSISEKYILKLIDLRDYTFCDDLIMYYKETKNFEQLEIILLNLISVNNNRIVDRCKFMDELIKY